MELGRVSACGYAYPLGTTAQLLTSGIGRHVVICQGPHHSIHIEVLYGKAEAGDAGWPGARFGKCQEVRSVTDAQEDRPSLARLHRHAEEPLVEVQRAPQVRYGERYLVQPQNTEGSGLPPGEQVAGEGQPRKGEKQASASQYAWRTGSLRFLDLVAHGSFAPVRLIPQVPGQNKMTRGRCPAQETVP